MSLGLSARLIYVFVAILMIVSLVIVPVVASAKSIANDSGKASTVRVYLIAVGDNGKAGTKIGCGDSVVAVTKKIAPTRAPLTASLHLVLSNHHQLYGQSGLYNALYQSRLELERAVLVNGTASIHLTGKLRITGVCDAPRVRVQLRYAALQFSTVDRVYVYVNGVLLSRALSSR